MRDCMSSEEEAIAGEGGDSREALKARRAEDYRRRAEQQESGGRRSGVEMRVGDVRKQGLGQRAGRPGRLAETGRVTIRRRRVAVKGRAAICKCQAKSSRAGGRQGRQSE